MEFYLDCPVCRDGCVTVVTTAEYGELDAEVVEGCTEGCILNPLDCAELQSEAISAQKENESWR